MNLHHLAAHPPALITADASRHADFDTASHLRRQLGLHPETRLVADLHQHLPRLHHPTNDKIIAEHGACLGADQIEGTCCFRDITLLQETLYLCLGHTKGEHFGIGLLVINLGCHIAFFRHHLATQLLHSLPLFVSDQQLPLRLGHLDAGEGDQLLAFFHLLPHAGVAVDNLSRDARCHLGGTVTVDRHLGGRDHLISQQSGGDGLGKNAHRLALLQRHGWNATFFLVLFFGIERGEG